MMNWPAHCAAVIPCLNEAGTIRKVVTGTQRFLPRVYVIDDGSTDQSAALAHSSGAVVISHTEPAGKGAALQAGFQQAAQDGFSWVITLDADGQHNPADLPRFLEATTEGVDLVIGNRLENPVGMPFIRRLVNRWMSRRLSVLTGWELPDSQCGYRLLRLGACAGLRFRCRHFEFESEILVALARAGARAGFVPIQTVYGTERSKVRPLKDTYRWLRWWLRARQGTDSADEQSSPPISGAFAERLS